MTRDREQSNMNDQPGRPNRDQPIIQELIDEHAQVSCDIIRIDSNTWAIHGLIAVDGDVLMAEFNSPDEATAAIEEIRTGLAQQAGPIAEIYGIDLDALS